MNPYFIAYNDKHLDGKYFCVIMLTHKVFWFHK